MDGASTFRAPESATIRSASGEKINVSGSRVTAAAFVERALRAALPPGLPVSFSTIRSARFVGSGRRRKALAELTMVDGLAATVEVGKWSDLDGAYWHRWTRMDGGAIFWDGARWSREIGPLFDGRA